MAWYTSPDNCINRPPLPDAWREQILNGRQPVCRAIASTLLADLASRKRPCFLALDGYKGTKLGPYLAGITEQLKAGGAEVVPFNVSSVFHPRAELDELARPHERPEDPAFGWLFEGDIEEMTAPPRVRETLEQWETLRAQKGKKTVVICHGTGAALGPWRHIFDRVAWVDVTREQLIIRSERNEVLPIGEDEPRGFPFKRAYYFEYPLLNRHRKRLLRAMDWYIDDSQENDPKLLPVEVYRALLAEMAGRPVSFKVFYMPGMFGGDEFPKRFNVTGLPNNSWDYEISVGDNHLLVDIGADPRGSGEGAPRLLELPFYHLIYEQQLRLLGSYCTATYPDHFPIGIYMQDGWFPNPKEPDYHRTHMPHHLHPDTAYNKEHFNEPLGRYETYYIVRADPGACTMHGFKDDADIDEYEREIRRSAQAHTEFDWRKYVFEHPSKTGELHQIPPGTVHGTGGRQVILEIDTNPSRESTEYSFFLYDFCRPCWNYTTNDMTGKPLRLHVDHGLAIMRRNRRQKFMAEKIRPAPVCIRSGKGWREMSFPMYYNMPYQVNRFELDKRIEDDTADMFHCLSLTLGTRARVVSLNDPGNDFTLEDCDTIVLPASFGPYAIENQGKGRCEVIKTTLITGDRSHIDKAREEKDWGRG
jgi:hypothetical protein